MKRWFQGKTGAVFTLFTLMALTGVGWTAVRLVLGVTGSSTPATTVSSLAPVVAATVTPTPTAAAPATVLVPSGRDTATPTVERRWTVGSENDTAVVWPASLNAQFIVVTPMPEGVGWVRQNDSRANHFGDYNMYAGVFDQQGYIGAVQFTLPNLAPNGLLFYADLTLQGLTDDYLAGDGDWTVEMLTQDMDKEWQGHSFARLAGDHAVSITLRPTLTRLDLGEEQTNRLVFDAVPLLRLKERLASGVISFRIQGPNAGPNNLFAWDSGYGTRSRGVGPVLRLGIVP